MKIAIISDIHDNFHNTVLALNIIKEKKEIERVIFLGDLIAPFISKAFVAYHLPVLMVWGNNDGNKVAITKIASSEGSSLEVADNIYHFLEVDNRKIFLTHYHDLAEPMAKSGEFDAIFYGHNHTFDNSKINNCLMLNPGELAGQKQVPTTFAIYDTITNTAEIIEIENARRVKDELVENYLSDNGIKL